MYKYLSKNLLEQIVKSFLIKFDEIIANFMPKR